jgi:GNAT superfamily N-acetyltransferase
MRHYKIRQSQRDDFDQIQSLVSKVVVEKYGHLFPAPSAAAHSPDRWQGSLIAEVDGALAGVGRINSDSIDDLWILKIFRSQGIGAELLLRLEQQIAQSGFKIANLRVVAENQAALSFYIANGWTATKRYPHEKWSFDMIDMKKLVSH